MNRSLLLILLAALLLSACGQIMPRPTLAPTLTVTPRPAATPTPRPTLTPTPTRVPNCPASNSKAEWVAPPDFRGYPGAIGAFLDAGGSADALRTILKNASAINDQFGGVWSRDLTGDGDPDAMVSLVNVEAGSSEPVPAGALLIYGCFDRAVRLLYQEAGQPLLQVKEVGDLIGAGKGGEVATIRSDCGAHTCFDTLDVLGWDGRQLVSLMGDRLQMPYPTFTFVNHDGDAAQEIQAVSGQIASVGAGPQRTITQTWDWNGAQYVKVSQVVAPPAYRIHAIHDADELLLKGDLNRAIELYDRVIGDDTLKDWLVEIGMKNPNDRANLSAYALYRMMIVDVKSGDVASAQAAFERLSADFPAGAPGREYQQLAQVFWKKYQETKNLSAACSAANAQANEVTDAIDGLNAFGYANRQYVANDMCPFVGP